MKISILGCGWLGLPLGKHLLKKGHDIKGSTTKSEKLSDLSKSGIEPYLIELSPAFIGDSIFLESELLILNIPPRNREGINNFHEQQLHSLCQHVLNSPIRKVLFISSTAVYPNLNIEVSETDADEKSLSRGGVPLVKMENIFRSQESLNVTVLRFGGLYGPNRNPGRFLAGKKDVSGGSNPVNMIHLDDCLGVINTIIDKNAWRDVFNACSPNHISRKEFYVQAAEKMGMEPPQFNDQGAPFKKVNSDKLIQKLKYQYKF